METKRMFFLFFILSSLYINSCSGYSIKPTSTPVSTLYFTFTPVILTVTHSFKETSTATPTFVNNSDCKKIKETNLYLLSDDDFFAITTTAEDINRALGSNYPEWANYEQKVTWNTEPVKLGEIILSASFQEQFAINSAVTLVTLGESLDWQLPLDEDLYSKSLSISKRLFLSAFEWSKPENEGIRKSYPEITNAATYAIYIFFSNDREKIQKWCYSYQKLF
ncbi:MAG TPA: hypothetical protein VNJ29_00195 [Candidatus Nitrosotenuis sp.]|nr:hypothetical protein [Candidatus Nitrosotenuis sp.]